MSWSDDVPRSRDGSPNWAADTDPVGTVTSELELEDPGPADGGHFTSEVSMSSSQFGDGNLGAPEPAPAPTQQIQPVQPLQPVEPLQPLPTLAHVTPEAPAPEAHATFAPPAEARATPALALADMRDVPLGTLVFRAGLLPEERLEEALQDGIRSGKRLGQILLERGLVSENDLGHLLAGQKGLPFVELEPTAIDLTAPPLLHPEKARLHGALPIGFEGGVPIVAVADPSNDLVVENVRRALNCEPVLVVAARDALYRAIDAAYGGEAETPVPAPAAAPAPPVDQAVELPAVPLVAVAETVAPVVPETPVAPEPVVAPVVEPAAPVLEPAAAAVVQEPVAAEPATEPVAPLVESLPAAPVLPVTPVATQPGTNGDGFWLGQVQEAAPAPLAAQQPVPPAPALEPQPEPIQAVQIVEPEPEFQAEPVAASPAAPAVDPEPVAPAQPVAPPAPSWIVEVRLANGERIEVGVHVGHEDAVEAARAVVAQASTEGSWPFLAGRFLRPDAIVSVDLVELAADRWLGSSARAAWGDQPQP